MRYFIDDGKVRSFSDEDVTNGYGSDLKEVSYTEAMEIINPPKTNDELFAQEMAPLNARYKSDTKKSIDKVSSAIGWDGETESTKVANARAELYQLKANYDTQSLAIINKYYGA